MIVSSPDGRHNFLCREGSPSDEAVIRETWVENVYRIHDSDFRPNGVLLDVGANIGAVSVFGSSLGAYVVAVEPEPDNLSYLQRNLDSNMIGGYRVLPVALGPVTSRARMTPCHGNSYMSSDGPVEVDVITVEAALALAGVDEVDVCKIDIEGAEYELIDSMPSSVLRRIRYLTMEFDGRKTKTAFGRMVGKLAHDFSVTTLGSPRRGGYIYARRYD